MQESLDIGTSPGLSGGPTVQAGYLTNARLELSEWMRRYAPSLAELYLGAVELVFGRPIPGRVTLICHAVREICNRLPGGVTGVEGGGTFAYALKVEEIAKEWERASPSGVGPIKLCSGGRHRLRNRTTSIAAIARRSCSVFGLLGPLQLLLSENGRSACSGLPNASTRSWYSSAH